MRMAQPINQDLVLQRLQMDPLLEIIIALLLLTQHLLGIMEQVLCYDDVLYLPLL